MKSKSPFAMKSPLLAYKSDMRGNYANPKYVKEELVGVKIGEALTKAGTDIFSGLTTKPKSESGDGGGSGGDVINNIHVNGSNGGSGSNVHNEGSGSNVHKGSDTDITTTTENVLGSDQGNTGNSYAKSYSGLSKDEGGNAKATGDFKGGNLDDWTNYVKDYNRKKNSTTNTTRNEVTRTWQMIGGKKVFGTQAKNPVTMKGSPNKLIGDTMDPYGQINPGAVPPNQAQNDLGAQPIISANGSQPSNRSIDMSAISDPYSALGADFGAGTRNKAQSIYGSAGQRQGLMNLGTPLHDKGHANDYEGHTHRKKGGSYKEGDYMDETDMETSYPKLYTQDVGEIKRDKKSQFMVSKNEDYSPTKIDTIRPLKGKEFKMGWGDAERNISTNPKYKKSK